MTTRLNEYYNLYNEGCNLSGYNNFNIDGIVPCVLCTQLTDNVTQATAGAVQRFLASCRSAILQANHRSDDEAIEFITLNNASVVDLYYPHQTETLHKLNCPFCIPGRSGTQRECCGNGQCVNSTCRCTQGRFNITDCRYKVHSRVLFVTYYTNEKQLVLPEIIAPAER